MWIGFGAMDVISYLGSDPPVFLRKEVSAAALHLKLNLSFKPYTPNDLLESLHIFKFHSDKENVNDGNDRPKR